MNKKALGENNMTTTIVEDCDGESQGTVFSRLLKKNPSPSLSKAKIGPRALSGYRSNLMLKQV